MDEDFFQKNTITRSVDRKINLGNYESLGLFCSKTVIMPNDATIIDYYHESQDLNAYLQSELELEAAKVKKLLEESQGIGDIDAYERVLECTRNWEPAAMEDFQKLSPYQSYLINEEKKRVKRTPEYKNRETTSNIENETNRR